MTLHLAPVPGLLHVNWFGFGRTAKLEDIENMIGDCGGMPHGMAPRAVPKT